MLNKKPAIYITVLNLAIVIVLFLSCTGKPASDLSKESLIPKPVSITPTGEYFKLKPGTDIILREDNKELKLTGQYLADKLKLSTGFKIDVRVTDSKPQSGCIVIKTDATRTALGEEGYELFIDKRIITLTAAKPAGLFRGIQTIRQLLPAKIESQTKQEGLWEIPTGTITDYPDYSYRGVMIDVSRHFFGVEDIKRVMEFLTYYKMNTLHLHLSDDQGWRIEIKSWPNLALHGGSTQVGGGKSEYYTQEQYSELVKYGQERYITIVPEIDMPGHTNAALASYAELNCDGKARELYTGTAVGFSTLCTKNEITYKFIDDIIRELAAITPGPYIHIGGDESNATKKEDYIPFVNRVQDIVKSHGKTIIGWDEIALSELKDNSIAQNWASAENAVKAVNQGVKILMSPAARAYLDMKYTKETKLGLRWAGLIEVDKGYNWDPATLFTGVRKENIIGVEAALWTETITNMEDMEYLIFPRLPGYAEIGWTPASMRSWDEYKERLGKHAERFKIMGINYYQSPLVPWPVAQ
jgi:hexosaminidase